METNEREEQNDFDEKLVEETKERKSYYWGKTLLGQAVVSFLVVALLGGIVRIPQIGAGLKERFRGVLLYESTLEAEVFQKWLRDLHPQKLWSKATNWFTGEIKEAIAPQTGSDRLLLPVAGQPELIIFTDRLGLKIASGTEIYTSASGLVTEVKKEGNGWKVRIEHTKDRSSVYYPLTNSLVIQGQWVRRREAIGRSAQNSEELFYWEVWSGAKRIDPRLVLKSEGILHDTD